MSGSIRIRKSKSGKVTYQLVIEKGVDSNGKRRRDFYSYKTRKEAQNALAEKINELNHNTYIEPSKMTVEQALDEWYATTVEPVLKANTKRGYLVNIGHLKKGIGRILLQKLTALQIQNFYNELEKQGFSPRSIQYIHTNLKSALKYFCKMQVISKNAAEFANVPKQKKAKNDYYTEEETQQLIEKSKDCDIYLEILLAVGMGLRRGEVLALTWDNVNFKTSSLTINKSLSRIEGTDIVSSTKTASGERTLKIPNFVLNALSERRQKQWNDRKILHEAYHENNLVCCRSDGSYYVCGSFTTKFSKHLNKIGMRHIRFHDLRHTNATLMLQYNVPIKVMSENLGHSNTGVTMDTYSHVTVKMKSETADKFDDELFSKIV